MPSSKKVVLVFLGLNVLLISAIPNEPMKSSSTEINNYIDKLINEMKKSLIENEMEPLLLPDRIRESSYTGLFGVSYKGNVSFTEGSLSGVTSMHRNGDVDMAYNNFDLHVAGRITFSRMMMKYDFITTFMGIGPEGTSFCYISDTSMDFEYDVHLLNLQSNITSFTISNAGKIHCDLRDVEFFVNKVLQAVINVIINLWEDTILSLLSTVLQDYLQSALNNIGPFII